MAQRDKNSSAPIPAARTARPKASNKERNDQLGDMCQIVEQNILRQHAHGPPPAGPLLVFDSDCSFCRAWVEYWKALTGDRVDYSPLQEIAERFPQVSPQQFRSAVQLILPDGEVLRGAHAVFTALAALPKRRWVLWLYEQLPGVATLCEAAYRTIAAHRSAGYWVTRLLWGVPVRTESYHVTGWLFLRLLGAIYLTAFVSFGVQAPGLIGSRGILPAGEFLNAVHESLGASAYWDVPTLLWLNGSDASLRAVWMVGVGLSLLLLLGANTRVIRVGLFVLYLSLDTAGQVFMSYQWDALLLEVGFLAVFLGSEVVSVKLFRWLLCRSDVSIRRSQVVEWRSHLAPP